MRIFITGRQGQVGYELRRTLVPLGEVVAFDRCHFDLSRPDSLASVLDAVAPDVIVNAAAYTAVDRAESERDLAFKVNAEAPRALARWAGSRGALLLHYSTDYVFDGSGDRPWREEDSPAPLSIYGASKLAGERAIAHEDCAYLVVRTSWVYASRGSNFLLTMLRLAREREELRVVDDQVGSPTWARTIADLTAVMLRRLGTSPDRWRSELESRGSVVHLTAAGTCSWYEFARLIFDSTSSDGRRLQRLLPIPSSAYPTGARRPLNSRLSIERLTSSWGIQPPAWDKALQTCLESASLAVQRPRKPSP